MNATSFERTKNIEKMHPEIAAYKQHIPETKLAKMRKRHLPSFTQNRKRKYADKLFLRILDELDVNTDELDQVIRKWERCRTTKTRFVPTPNGIEKREYPHNCKLPFCQRCNSWMKKQEAKTMLERFLMLLGNDPMNTSDFSVLTINGVIKALGSDFQEDKLKMAKQIRYRLSKFDDVVLQGEFEIAKHRKSKKSSYAGKLHLHGILYHSKYDREKIADELRKAFKGPRDIQINPTYTERDGIQLGSEDYQERIEKDIETFANYTCDVDICLSDDAEGTGQVLFDHLMSICSIWSGGKRGLRFQPGLQAAFKKRGLTVPKPKTRSLRTTVRELLVSGDDEAYDMLCEMDNVDGIRYEANDHEVLCQH